jgi:hypothetical protein
MFPGLPAIAGVPALVGVHAVAFVPVVAGFPAVAGFPSVAGFLAITSVHVDLGVLIFSSCDHGYRTVIFSAIGLSEY